MTPPPSRILVFAAIGVALLAAIALVVHLRTSPSAVIEDAIDKQLVRDSAATSQEDAAISLPAQVERAVQDASLPGVPQRSQLASTVRETLETYFDPDPEAMLTLMRTQGIEPPSSLRSLSDFARRHWDIQRALFVNSTFDPERCRVIDSKRRTPYADRLPDGASFLLGRRDAARPFLAVSPPDGEARETVELVLPAQFVGQDGAEFDGSLMLEVTHHQEQRSWVLTAVGLAGVPNNATAVPPLL